MNHVSHAIQKALQEASSPTTSTPQRNTAAPRDPETALTEATQLAARTLAEIQMRWPAQAPWASDDNFARSWGRAIIEQPFAITWKAIARAIGKLSDRPYPPNIGALIAACKPEQLVRTEEAREALLQIDRASATGKWWKLSPIIWQALHELPGGSARVRNRDEHGKGASEFLKIWQAAMTRAIEYPDPSIRANQPHRPAVMLGPSDEEMARRASVAEHHLKEISQMLGIRPPEAS